MSARVKVRIAALVGAFAALLFMVVLPARAAPTHVSVYFLQGEQLASVQRPGKTPLDAMRQLLAGPTRAERGQGFRTYLPAGTRVLSLSVAHGVATVDLNERFAAGSDRDELLARLSQVVRTLTGPQGAKRVQLLMNGGIVAARFPGISSEPPDHVSLPADAERRRSRAPGPQASATGRCGQERAGAPDRARLSAAG